MSVDAAAEPVSFPESVSVPDTGVVVAVAVLLPDDVHAASPAASASTAVRAARFFISPLLVSVQPWAERLTIGARRPVPHRAEEIQPQSRRLIHIETWAGSRAWCTTPARSSRTASRSTASFSRAANAATVLSAS